MKGNSRIGAQITQVVCFILSLKRFTSLCFRVAESIITSQLELTWIWERKSTVLWRPTWVNFEGPWLGKPLFFNLIYVTSLFLRKNETTPTCVVQTLLKEECASIKKYQFKWHFFHNWKQWNSGYNYCKTINSINFISPSTSSLYHSHSNLTSLGSDRMGKTSYQ